MPFSDQLQTIIDILEGDPTGLHLQEGVDLNINIESVTINIVASPPAILPRATKAVLTIGGNMAGQITIDTTNETVELGFQDAHGNAAAQPAGSVVAFTSDNAAVATVATDATDPLKGDITPVAVGTANIDATVTDASGNPLLEADGVTPWATIAPVAVTVSGGAATGAALTLSA